MPEQWTCVITAPVGETIELKYLHEYLLAWKHAARCDDAGRAWTISASEVPVNLEYQGRSKRPDLVNRITCTVSSRAAADDAQLMISFADKLTAELGWQTTQRGGVEVPGRLAPAGLRVPTTSSRA